MNISHYGFDCPVIFTNEKFIRVKKKNFLETFLRKNRYQVRLYSYSYSQEKFLFADH